MFPKFNRSQIIVHATAVSVATVFLCVASFLENHSKQQITTRSNSKEESDEVNVKQVTFLQEIDHFSDDQRAMSPRSWGNYFETSDEPLAPKVSFSSTENQFQESLNSEQNNPMQQVENSRVREPKQFYKSEPIENDDQEIAPQKNSNASPLPIPDQSSGSNGKPELGYNLNQPPVSESESPHKTNNLGTQKFGATRYGQFFLEQAPNQSGKFINEDHGEYGNSALDGSKARQHWFNRQQRRPNCDSPDDWDEFGQISKEDLTCPLPPKYNHHLGHRYPSPIQRSAVESSTEKFSFEEDGDFPPASEIIANSIFFSEFEFLFIQPSFQGNTAVTIDQMGNGRSDPFNFDLEPAFRVMAGYESDYGPGLAIDYFQFDNNSDDTRFVSDGVAQGETRVYQLGPNRWTGLVADDLGESIAARHSLEVHSTSVYAFKAIKFKRAYINGRFGIQIATVDQTLEADLVDSNGVSIGSLTNISNLSAFGPRFGIDYVRKVGHTPAQLVVSATSSLLFGDRDQLVQNTDTGELSTIGADEFLTTIDIFLGIQGRRIRGEKRNTAFRAGFVNQSWLGGGTAIDPNGDFGFQGFSLMLGFNR